MKLDWVGTELGEGGLVPTAGFCLAFVPTDCFDKLWEPLLWVVLAV